MPECAMVRLTDSSRGLPQKSNTCHVTEQFHIWVCTQKNRIQRWRDLATMFIATECLLAGE